ncbi:hypothetical protein K9N50_03995 [bacterium]|nr:hypothetical protein [bacterium]
MRNQHNIKFTLKIFLLASFLLIGLNACEEQPLGYVYRPDVSDEASVARVTAEIVSMMYDRLDMASGFLEDASHTNRYSTILPAGWVEEYNIVSSENDTVAINFDLTSINADRVDVLDTLDNMLAISIVDLDTFYTHNHLDNVLQKLSFDTEPVAGAVRTPSSLEYGYDDYRQFFNFRTSTFYRDINESSNMNIEYADNAVVGDRQDPNHIQGWTQVTRSVAFSETIDLGDYEYDYIYYEYPTWIMKIEKFSVDPTDQSSRILIEGTFPHNDDLDIYREDHVSGEIEIGANGVGEGEMSLYGKPIAKLYFTGRSAGFNGYFTLESQNYEYLIGF